MQIFVSTSLSDLILIDCEPDSKIYEIKTKIKVRDNARFDVNYQLFYNSQTLVDNKALNDYDIKNFATIQLKRIRRDYSYKETERKEKFPHEFNCIEELQDLFLTQLSKDYYWNSTRKLQINSSTPGYGYGSGLVTTFDSKYYIICNEDTSIEIFDFKTGEQAFKFDRFYSESDLQKTSSRGPCMALTKDNKNLYVAMFEGEIVLYDLVSKKKPTYKLTDIKGKAFSIFFLKFF